MNVFFWYQLILVVLDKGQLNVLLLLFVDCWCCRKWYKLLAWR